MSSLGGISRLSRVIGRIHFSALLWLTSLLSYYLLAKGCSQLLEVILKSFDGRPLAKAFSWTWQLLQVQHVCISCSFKSHWSLLSLTSKAFLRKTYLTMSGPSVLKGKGVYKICTPGVLEACLKILPIHLYKLQVLSPSLWLAFKFNKYYFGKDDILNLNMLFSLSTLIFVIIIAK